MANWSRLSLPSMPAPASHRFCDTVLSYCGVKPSRMWLAAVVCTPLVANRSFIPMGTPPIAPRSSPFARFASVASAAASAWSGVVTMKALRSAASATAALKASATSRAVKSPPATPSRMALTPRFVRSVILNFRHPSESWDLYRARAKLRQIPAFAGMTINSPSHHSITLGTPKKPCSAAGALASTSSRLPPPVSGMASTTSSRRRR